MTVEFDTFPQGLACWSSSHTYVLLEFGSDVWPYFIFCQWQMALSGSGWEVLTRISS